MSHHSINFLLCIVSQNLDYKRGSKTPPLVATVNTQASLIHCTSFDIWTNWVLSSVTDRIKQVGQGIRVLACKSCQKLSSPLSSHCRSQFMIMKWSVVIAHDRHTWMTIKSVVSQQAAILCQFLENIDYSTALRCLQERSAVDAMDAYYCCLWDVSLIEFIINMHHKRGEVQRRDKAVSTTKLFFLEIWYLCTVKLLFPITFSYMIGLEGYCTKHTIWCSVVYSFGGFHWDIHPSPPSCD